MRRKDTERQRSFIISQEVAREREKNFFIIFISDSGIHLTGNAYVPTYLLKVLAATEYKGELSLGDLKNFTLAEINELQLGNLLKSIQEIHIYYISQTKI